MGRKNLRQNRVGRVALRGELGLTGLRVRSIGAGVGRLETRLPTKYRGAGEWHGSGIWGAAKLAEVEARGRVGFAGSGISGAASRLVCDRSPSQLTRPGFRLGIGAVRGGTSV